MVLAQMLARGLPRLCTRRPAQIYADPCFVEVPELIEWGKFNHVRDLPKAIRLPATDGLERNVTSWYFNHYMKSFQRDRILDVMASIPQICEWDDHDVYDGAKDTCAPPPHVCVAIIRPTFLLHTYTLYYRRYRIWFLP